MSLPCHRHAGAAGRPWAAVRRAVRDGPRRHGRDDGGEGEHRQEEDAQAHGAEQAWETTAPEDEDLRKHKLGTGQGSSNGDPFVSFGRLKKVLARKKALAGPQGLGLGSRGWGQAAGNWTQILTRQIHLCGDFPAKIWKQIFKNLQKYHFSGNFGSLFKIFWRLTPIPAEGQITTIHIINPPRSKKTFDQMERAWNPGRSLLENENMAHRLGGLSRLR